MYLGRIWNSNDDEEEARALIIRAKWRRSNPSSLENQELVYSLNSKCSSDWVYYKTHYSLLPTTWNSKQACKLSMAS